MFGKLGYEIQSDNEGVIPFANRLRENGSRIFEKKKKEDGTVSLKDKKEVEEAIISCFSRGLKPQIETRLPLDLAVEEVMKKAVEVEKQYNTRASLLASVTRHENRHKSVLACDTCQREGHISKDGPRNQKFCKYCKTPAHNEEYCYLKKKQNKETCQICGRSEHNSKNLL